MFILLHGEINIFILRQPCNYRKKTNKAYAQSDCCSDRQKHSKYLQQHWW